MTAAFGHPLVRHILKAVDAQKGEFVLDPFVGTGTVTSVCQELGFPSVGVELNPFLADLALLKANAHSLDVQALARKKVAILGKAREVNVLFQRRTRDQVSRLVHNGLPPLANIDRWWSSKFLKEALALREAIYEVDLAQLERVFFLMAASIILTEHDNTGGHVSLGYASIPAQASARALFANKVDKMIADLLALPRPRESAVIVCGDSTTIDATLKPYMGREKFRHVITSPPYCNRFTYTRETRAQLYFSGRLRRVSEAGSLDLNAIGGTWGIATHRLRAKNLPEPIAPVRDAASDVLRQLDGKGKEFTKNYVAKFFSDTYRHLRSLRRVTARGATLSYVVGDSILAGVRVQTDQILAELMRSCGYQVDKIEIFRRRWSKPVHEACILAHKP